MVRRPRTNPLLLLASLLVACGGAAAGGAEPKPPPATVPPEGSASPTLVAPNMGEAKRELDDGIAAFQAAGKDCVMLCKALASMTRAADRICSLSESSADPTDKQKCEDARAKVNDATQSVKSTCGGCAGP